MVAASISGVVGSLAGKLPANGSLKGIGLRADIDALDIIGFRLTHESKRPDVDIELGVVDGLERILHFFQCN